MKDKIKIAIINTGSTLNRKGAFNNVHERIVHLKEVKNVTVEAFLIRHYKNWIFLFFKKNEIKRDTFSTVNGVTYRNIWIKLSIWDFILTYRLKCRGLSGKAQLYRYVSLFEGFDLLSVHALPDMYLAYLVKQKFNIPFVTTWHGSDINVRPFLNKQSFQITRLIMENADFNFFVSKKLMVVSDKIALTDKKDFLYTGPSNLFLNNQNVDKIALKKKFNIQSKFVVGFIGNLTPIKNVHALAPIFNSINNQIGDVCFLIIGDGELKGSLKERLNSYNLANVLFIGKMEPEEIPEILSCFDVLLLPSLNEGMPRVTLEAIACGVHVVGSNVGGIPESIGEANAFALDNFFVENVTNRVIEIVKSGVKPAKLSDEFSWNNAIEKEMNVYNQILQ
ncbi:MAG: glycosyltransferase family 4 protein [Bacteroidales bacterium]|nr:glycosyltransferase family 4 protein [Bacteroidales bacterium]